MAHAVIVMNEEVIVDCPRTLTRTTMVMDETEQNTVFFSPSQPGCVRFTMVDDTTTSFCCFVLLIGDQIVINQPCVANRVAVRGARWTFWVWWPNTCCTFSGLDYIPNTAGKDRIHPPRTRVSGRTGKSRQEIISIDRVASDLKPDGSKGITGVPVDPPGFSGHPVKQIYLCPSSPDNIISNIILHSTLLRHK